MQQYFPVQILSLVIIYCSILVKSQMEVNEFFFVWMLYAIIYNFHFESRVVCGDEMSARQLCWMSLNYDQNLDNSVI